MNGGLKAAILIMVIGMILLFVGQWAFGFLPSWAVAAIIVGLVGTSVTIAIKTGN